MKLFNLNIYGHVPVNFKVTVTFSSLLFIILLSLFSVDIFPQTYNISGTVSDASGNPLVGANVILIGEDIGAASDEVGKYIINNIKPGNYQIEFSSIGYQSFISGVQIGDQSVIINAVLHEKPS